MNAMKRIALIHALRHSPPPVEAAFAALWPGQRLMNRPDQVLPREESALDGPFLNGQRSEERRVGKGV